ncbi:beta-propeller domain-containing protein [Spirillospora albida]|uniref:beta-propeller domain-containing protein n=1 Tax=Spirillospora albida TaxID=58123 RepID=UPI0004C089EE|nr:beta-propeller domain-containing protein [Spirillospora albida]
MRAPTLAVLAAAVTLAAAGCSGAPAGAPAPDAPPMRLVAYDGCGPLLDGLRRAALERVGPYGLDGGPAEFRAMPKGAVPEAAARAPAPEHSTTNTHEPGADEPDLVKTDGRRIVTLSGGRLQVVDPASRRLLHSLPLPGHAHGERLLLSGDRVLVLSGGLTMAARPAPGSAPGFAPGAERSRLTLVDLSGTPEIVGEMASEAEYVDARQSGHVVRVVMRSVPRIRFPYTPRVSPEKAVERNREAIRKAPLDAWIPGFDIGGRTYRTPCDQVSRPAGQPGTSMLTVLTLDLARGLGDPSPVSVAADGATVYGNGASLYVTGSPWGAEEQRTHVHRFDVGGAGRPVYVASGSVPGGVLNQYSMSEHDGNLRIATTTQNARSSESAVHVLARRGLRLTEIGRLGGLGKGERIHSVRFLGATAYVVTFRQVDPLYVVDLKDPRRPRLTGELKIPGYSAYLHPLADGRLLGVGQDADPATGRTRGTQVSLFDVSGEPRRIASYRLPGAHSEAEFEPHAFLYRPASGLTVIPVTRPGRGGSEALALTVAGGTIRRLGTVGTFGDSVRRSLVVGPALWTISDQGARAVDAATLEDLGRVRFEGR